MFESIAVLRLSGGEEKRESEREGQLLPPLLSVDLSTATLIWETSSPQVFLIECSAIAIWRWNP
jgi:hypothetical protein